MIPEEPNPPERRISLAEIAWVFAMIGITSFGGGLTGYIQQIVVARRHWVTADKFLEGVELCQIMPGPNAINLAVYLGSHLRGWRGAVVAVTSMIFLPFIVVIILGALYFKNGELPAVNAVMTGLGGAVVGLTLASSIQVGHKHLTNALDLVIVTAAFLCVSYFHIHLLPTIAMLTPLSVLLHMKRAQAAKEGTRNG